MWGTAEGGSIVFVAEGNLGRTFLRRWRTFVFVYSNQFGCHCIVRSVQMSVRCIQKCVFTKIKIEIRIVFMYNDRVVVLTRPPKDIYGRYAFPKGVFNHVYR